MNQYTISNSRKILNFLIMILTKSLKFEFLIQREKIIDSLFL